MQLATDELALMAKDKIQGCIVDPLIADKTLREKIVGVSAVTWWHWRKQGRLPKSLTIGRRRFYRRSDIENWLDEMISAEPTVG
ncbi:MAG: helix-turn-helix transcriptional regulator [Desulfobacter sp.]